ncbi:MAG: YIP1 family protein [Bacteroidota bacterium]
MAPAIIRLRRDLRLAVDVLATPTDVFAELAAHPRWGAAFVLFAPFVVFNALLMRPFLDALTYQRLESLLPPEQIDIAVAASHRMQIVQLPFSAIFLPVRWLFLSTIISGLLAISSHRSPPFAILFSVVAFSQAVLVVMDLVNLLLLYWNGPDAVRGVPDLDAIRGLALLMPDRSARPALAAFLGNFNPFTLWHTVTIGIGISVVSGHSRMRSFLIASLAWILTGALASGAAYLATPSP